MALTTAQILDIKKAGAKFLYEKRPPLEIRDKLDIGYRIEGQSVYVFEIRPRWDNPEEIMESDVARTTYVKAKNLWKIYWLRADLKWHHFQPAPFVKNINEFFDMVRDDPFACFFG